MAAFYNDGRAIRELTLEQYGYNSSKAAFQLPSGTCNFRDLASGGRAPICGCKRFWLNNANPNAQLSGGDNAWCFCGHHACFHNASNSQDQQPNVQPFTQTSITATAAAAATAIVPRVASVDVAPCLTPDGYLSVQQAGAVTKQPTGLGIRPDSRSQSRSINTRVWEALNGFARYQEDPALSESTSKLPSTAVPSVNGDELTRSMGPPITIPPHSQFRPAFEDAAGSATEVATPSIAGTPDFQAFVPPTNTQPQASPAQPSTSHAVETQPAAIPLHESQPPIISTEQLDHALSIREIQDTLRSQARRIDLLESLSFSQVPLEEVQEKFELFDGRLLDLEQWRDDTQARERNSLESDLDLSNAAKSSSSKRKKQPFAPDLGSFASDESFDSTAAAHAEAAVLATIAANSETRPRIEALENRVADLESAALPSFVRPWTVQVVLLPWGRDLRGIWFPSAETSQHPASASTSNIALDEWTGAVSQTNISFRSSNSGAWTTESIQAWAEDAQDWLSPKACGPTGSVFHRLASKGLVRDVTFTASDSRHILDVLSGAFAHILPSMGVEKPASPAQHYQGLREAFLPLRKVRKSTRLRFLSPAEMTTSATWTAGFLDASIFMKVSDRQRRLYITTPDAYLQSSDQGWTWNSLRQLPARDANGDQYVEQIDRSVAIEACWTYHEKLDHVPTVEHSSFDSSTSHQSHWSIKSQQATEYERASIGQLTPALTGSEPKAIHNRTLSLPSSTSAQEQLRGMLPKRRVASFESTAPVAAAVTNVATESGKRRRISMSPEIDRKGVNFTPRWSREPPSPFQSEHTGEARSQGASSSRKRGNTPFAYATPHSNSQILGPVDIGDGDTERNTEVDDMDHEGEEWEGMDEAALGSSDEDSAGDDMGDDDVESNGEEEEMIYEHV